MPCRSAAITVDSLTKRYGAHTAVDQLSFEVPQGVVCGLVGRAGAGKTTTLRMLLGLVRPSLGSALVLGRPIERPRAYLSRVGAVLGEPAFHPSLSGRRNLHLLAAAGGQPRQRVTAALTRAGLDHRAETPVRSYSSDSKKRLAIAAALLPEPELVILDDAGNGLDPRGVADVHELVHELADHGCTVLFADNNLDEIGQIADHVVLLEAGRVSFCGPTEDLRRTQRQRTVAVLERPSDLVGLVTALRGHALRFEYRTDGSFEVDCDQPALVNRIAHDAGVCLAGLSLIRHACVDVVAGTTDDRQVRCAHGVRG